MGAALQYRRVNKTTAMNYSSSLTALKQQVARAKKGPIIPELPSLSK